MPTNPKLIREVFEHSMDQFFQHEVQEVLEGVNERNNCGRMSKRTCQFEYYRQGQNFEESTQKFRVRYS